MAQTDPKVMALVEKALGKTPDISGDELYKMAKKASRAVGRMSRRQFHARYPLQIKRRQKGGAQKAAKAVRTRASATAKAATKTVNRKAAGKVARKAATQVQNAVKRGRPTVRRSQRKAAAAGDRDAVRAVFMSFAADLSAAEDRKDAVRVVANVDQYVDKAMKSVG